MKRQTTPAEPVRHTGQIELSGVWTISGKPVEVRGDLNNDGEADLADTILALKVLSGIDTYGLIRTDYDIKVDVDGDDRIGLAEAIHGLQIAAELR